MQSAADITAAALAGTDPLADEACDMLMGIVSVALIHGGVALDCKPPRTCIAHPPLWLCHVRAEKLQRSLTTKPEPACSRECSGGLRCAPSLCFNVPSMCGDEKLGKSRGGLTS